MKKAAILLLFFLFLSATAVFAQLRLSLQAGVQIPTSDFAESAGTGFGFNGTFEYWQNTPLSFTGSVGYNSFGPKDDLPSGWDYNLTTIPILVGLRYYLSRGDFHPYIGAELGLYLISFEITRQVGGVEFSADDSDSKFGFAPIFGFRYHVSPNADLDFNFKYNVITTDENTTTFIGINGGVQFGL